MILATCIAGALLFITLPGSDTQARPLQDAIVRCDPSPFQTNDATTLSIDLYIQDVAELYGADVRLGFNPNVLEVQDADNYAPNGVQVQPLNGFLSPDWVVRNEVDHTEGTIWYAVAQLGHTSPLPANGSGGIARATFKTFQAGEYLLDFRYQKLAKSNGAQIPATTQDCTIGFWGAINLSIARVPAGHELAWAFLGNSITRAEVFRSTTNPYLLPNEGDAAELLPGPSAGGTTFVDVSVDTSVNQYYIAWAVHGDGTTRSAPSNRVGAFHYHLVPGTAP
jgi:hypothetical protein